MDSPGDSINYYLVAPSAAAYRGDDFLTYKSNQKLSEGQVVKITLKNRPILGVVIRQVDKPEFKTHGLEAIAKVILPKANVELMLWTKDYYASSIGVSTQYFVPRLLSAVTVEDEKSGKPKKIVLNKLPELTSEQKTVIKQMKGSNKRTFLLHGETGSGKTRVYIEMAAECLWNDKSTLLLVPEISLTAPMIKSLETIFGKNKVLCIHSNLTPSQKKEIWRRLFSRNDPCIVIGPRSAIFLPINDLGLIVVDECHDQAYKQESAPYFNANRLAAKLAEISKAKIIFGTGTPLVNEYFLAQSKEIPILRMKNSAIKNHHDEKPAMIVDMTDKKESTSYPALSATLISETKKAIKDGSQVMLFLNKRGSARAILCSNCGWRKSCPNCDSPLTLHQDEHKLQCHTCGYRQSPPTSCPECGSLEIVFKSPGTKAVEQSMKKIFPSLKVARFDRDNKKDERMEQNYDKVLSGEYQIIIGTQLLAKGHDLPNLGLVAVLAADGGLNFPDYTSEERSFQLMSQIKGRINRGHRPGRLLIQTYNLKNPLIKQVLSGNWDEFYKQQLYYRKKLGFPPFVHALKIEAAKATKSGAQKAIENVFSQLSSKGELQFIGPAPCFMEKKASKYHWQLIVTSKNRKSLVDAARSINNTYKTELDPLHFL